LSPRTRRTALVVALGGLIALALVVLPALSAPAAPVAATGGTGPQLRVMTWNVRTADFDPDDWAPVVADLRPDVVGLQEVCAGEAQRLADLLGDEHDLDYEVAVGGAREARYPGCEPTAAGPASFGQAVLSRVPLRDAANTALPDGGGVDEPRAFLSVVLDAPGGPVRLLTTHITIGPGAEEDAATGARRTALQAEQVEVVARAAAAGERVLVVGDLNMVPGDPRLAVLHEAGLREVDAERNAATSNNRPDRPGSPAERKLDHVFVRGLAPVDAPRTLWVPSSDHRPLVATLRP
jgi:endonuclease/exonuclease/phosphatase family metal-dependent hydrolase